MVRTRYTFWSKVERAGGDGCWLWRGTRDPDGYGLFKPTRATLVRAHRYAYAAEHGAIPDGMQVLHRCDVRACVNPAHLFLGTNADNLRDMAVKSRAAKMPAEDVRWVREWRDAGWSCRLLAGVVGCSQVQVYRLASKERRQHV
jgi:hypothetical protein